MAKTKKAEQVQEAVQEQEAVEETQEATQETEMEEETQEATRETEMEEETQEAAPEPEAAEQDEKAEPDMFADLPNPCVYCGPSVKGVARQYTTYQGGIPEVLRKFIREHPGALELIVSTGRFQTMRRRLETYGTKEAELYKTVKAAL